jgi:hypothetical protein
METDLSIVPVIKEPGVYTMPIDSIGNNRADARNIIDTIWASTWARSFYGGVTTSVLGASRSKPCCHCGCSILYLELTADRKTLACCSQ